MTIKKKEEQTFTATGRRKLSVARVRLNPEGKGRILINGRDMLQYFPTVEGKSKIKRSLKVQTWLPLANPKE